MPGFYTERRASRHVRDGAAAAGDFLSISIFHFNPYFMRYMFFWYLLIVVVSIVDPAPRGDVQEAWLGAAIAATAGLVASLFAARQNKKTNEAQMELSKYGFAQNQAAIDRQNLYNAPVQQMSRFTDAGLNPNLIYGQGSSGQQASAAQYSVPKVDYRFDVQQIPAILSQYQDFQVKQAQVDNINAGTENTRSRTATEALQRMLIGLQGQKGTFELDLAKQMAPYEVDIKHGEAQAAYPKLMRQFVGLEGDKLSNLMKGSALQGIELRNERQRLDIIYNQYRNQWMKMGITSGDHVLLRTIVRMMGSLGLEPGQLFDGQ